MRSAIALLRSAFLTGTSYRLATVLSLVGLIASVVPLYFIADALQPVVAESISNEGGDYFGFLIVGIAATYVMIAAVSAIPAAVGGSLGSGTFEALLVTRTPLPVLLLGMSLFPLAQSLLRVAVLLVGARAVGVEFDWMGLPLVLGVLVLLILAYVSIGLVATALVLVFRTSGPLLTAVIAGSGLLGGVYYSTTVIPDWLRSLSAIVPLSYALRAMRAMLLAGGETRAIVNDVSALLLIAVLSFGVASIVFGLAMRHARRSGTLAQY